MGIIFRNGARLDPFREVGHLANTVCRSHPSTPIHPRISSQGLCDFETQIDVKGAGFTKQNEAKDSSVWWALHGHMMLSSQCLFLTSFVLVAFQDHELNSLNVNNLNTPLGCATNDPSSREGGTLPKM